MADDDTMSEQNAIDVLNRLSNVPKPTKSGLERIQKQDTRVRQFLESVKAFPEKPSGFRLATAAMAAHAEDCYWMWSFWKQGMDIASQYKNFRYQPSFYLNDAKLKADLLKIETAKEMEGYLKLRYGTKQSIRPPSKKRQQQMKKQQRRISQEAQGGDPESSVSAGQPSEATNIPIIVEGSTPITVMNCPVGLQEFVQKANAVTGSQMKGAEIYAFFQQVTEFPCSTVAPVLAPVGSLFVYKKTTSPGPYYKRDGYGFGKESHSVLIIDKLPRIKTYYGTLRNNIQRRSYYLLDDPTYVIVHYTREDTASASCAKEEKRQASEIDETSKKKQKVSSGKCDFRALVALGARVHIPELSYDVFCDAINALCHEEASTTEELNYKTLMHASQEIFGVKFDDISSSDMKETWLVKVGDHPSSAEITAMCASIVRHLKGSLVAEDVKAAFEKASQENTLMAMVLALGKLRKVPDIPEDELRMVMNKIMKSGLSEELQIRFALIRDAIMDNDIQFAKFWVKSMVSPQM